MTGELWGGVAAFLVLSGGLFVIWKDFTRRIDNLGSNHLKHTNDRIDRVDERLKEANAGHLIQRVLIPHVLPSRELVHVPL